MFLRIKAAKLFFLVKKKKKQEPLGGAHADPSWTSQQIKKAINETMDVSATCKASLRTKF
jgi:hypothetical protein